VLAGCSFDKRPFIPGGSPGGTQGRAGSGSAGRPSAPRDARASDPGDAASTVPGLDASGEVPQAGGGNSGTGGTSAGGSGGGGGNGSGGSGGSDEPDASMGSGGKDSDAPDCEQPRPACVCAHTRLETPADPCAAPDCPLAECAPDDDCVLKRFASSVYYVCSLPHSQPDALTHCQSIPSMHLVYIGSAEENAFVHANITGKVWIGAVENEEDVWTWLDGTPFYDDEPVDDAYVNWDESVLEPNGAGVGEGEVTCAILWSETAAWADTNCPAQNGYVCELEL
jgi:hypothetical protein